MIYLRESLSRTNQPRWIVLKQSTSFCCSNRFLLFGNKYCSIPNYKYIHT